LIGGRFRLIELIGQGGMGRVWRGRDQLLDRDVAVKEVLIPAGTPEADRSVLIARTSREARSAARLNHPGVVTIHDVVEHDSAPWIVMEFVQGRSLAAEIAAAGALPWARAAEIGWKIADALAHAHAAGIVHRDLKPDNVLLSGDRVVVTDFGIARMVDATNPLTSPGMVLGTPQYMAPERFEGRDVGAPADMWGLGATLHTAVEGQPPFDGPDLASIVAVILTQDPAPAPHAGPLAGLLAELFTKQAWRRPTAAYAARALRNLGTEPAGTPPPEAVSPWKPVPSWKTWHQPSPADPPTETIGQPGGPAGPAQPGPVGKRSWLPVRRRGRPTGETS
jgi:serine/threonine protein kinase